MGPGIVWAPTIFSSTMQGTIRYPGGPDHSGIHSMQACAVDIQMAIYGPYMTIYGHICPYMAIYGPYMAIYDHI